MTAGVEWSHPAASWLDPGTGSVIGHRQLMREVSQANVLLLGETHDRYDIHRWQLHVCAAMRALRDDVAIGFEMFPRRVQPALERRFEAFTGRPFAIDGLALFIEREAGAPFTVHSYRPLRPLEARKTA